MKNEKALVLLSGGQDSVTCLFWAKQEFKEVVALSIDYGQRHSIELEAAQRIAKLAEVRHEIITVPGILLSSSPLTSSTTLELYEDFDSMDAIIGERIEKTFVPMRNALFLVLAANHAVAWGCGNIVIGACEADNANYPDCRESFISSMERATNLALGSEHLDDLKFVAPLLFNSKAETVHLAYNLPGCYEALAYSHTAYDGTYPPTSKDHASVLRAHGFEEAGLPDPLVLRAVFEGRMTVPTTANYDVILGAPNDADNFEEYLAGIISAKADNK